MVNLKRARSASLGWLFAILVAAVFALGSSESAHAESRRYMVTVQAESLAPNAGGQEAYSLRLGTNNWEGAVFTNLYLTSGNRPLTGAVYDWRFPICDDSCWWQFFVQLGGGASTGGPLLEATWGMVLPLLPLWLPTQAPPFVPALRLDITSQMILIRYRGVTWSYPLWAGISVSF